MIENSRISRGVYNSLSAAVAQLWQLGYRLHRLAYLDLFFVHEAAVQDVKGEASVAQDEWACYLENLIFMRPGDAGRIRSWLLTKDLASMQADVMRYVMEASLRKTLREPSSVSSPVTLGVELGISAV